MKDQTTPSAIKSTAAPLGKPIEIDNPSNRARSIVIGIEKLIPKVGGLLSTLTAVYWPMEQASIWDLVKDQVHEAIDRAILKKEIEDRKNELEALKEHCNQYSIDKGDTENSQALTAALTSAIDLKSKLTGSSNGKHLLPITVFLSQLHLAILRERLIHGLKLYNPNEDKQKSSIKNWYEELNKTYDYYKKYFLMTEIEWAEWRQLTLSYKIKNSKQATVFDSVTKQEYLYKIEHKSKELNLESQCKATISTIFRSSKAELANYLAMTFTLNRYLPDPEKFNLKMSVEALGYFSDNKDMPLFSMNKKTDIIKGYENLWIGVIYHTNLPSSANSSGMYLSHDIMYEIPEKELVIEDLVGLKLHLTNPILHPSIEGFQAIFKNHDEPILWNDSKVINKGLNMQFELPEHTEDMSEAPYIYGLGFDYSGHFTDCDVFYWDGTQTLRTDFVNRPLTGYDAIRTNLHAGPSYQIKAIHNKTSQGNVSYLIKYLHSFKVYLEYKEPNY